MGAPDLLPDDLVWQPDGHLSETALTCLADGEEALLPDPARTHADACEACAKRLGLAAMLSMSSSEALKLSIVRAAERVPPPAPKAPVPTPRASSRPPGKKPLPLSAIAAALTLALLGSAPSVINMFARLPETTASFTVAVPVVARSVVVVLKSPEGGLGGAVSAISWIAAATLIVIGALVARAAPRRKKRSVEGGT